MAKVSPEAAEVNARIVYWGIEGAGKRTSLDGVSRKLRPDHRGEMREVPTRLDPSACYTVLPIELGEIGGTRTRIELVAVPGSPELSPIRKQLLDQVDGVVLVVDSQESRIQENAAILEELHKGLADYARRLDEIPLVVQYNKRDLPEVSAVEDLRKLLNPQGVPDHEAVARTGIGVFDTLKSVAKLVVADLKKKS
jgi:signal recognition particle receptor subunit beta